MPDSNQLKQLRRLVQELDHTYYTLGEPQVSDPEYDNIKRELVKLEEGMDIDITSPTQTVGAPVEAGSRTHQHVTPLLSLNNTFNLEESIRKLVRMEKTTGKSLCYVLQDKADGLTCKLGYTAGKLNLMATRGDGHVGELIDITGFDVPQDIGEVNDLYVVGEMVLDIETFTDLNRTLTETGQKEYISPRNAAVGLLRKHPEVLTFIAFSAHYQDGTKLESTEVGLLNTLRGFGFKTIRHSEPLSVEEVEAAIPKWEVNEDYDCDGIVVKVDDVSVQEELGEASTTPNWAFAHKQNSEGTGTVLTDVIWQVGVHGGITPVGVVDPVVASKAVVSRVNLHNAPYILAMGLKINGGVKVIRSGEVIPMVVGTDSAYDRPPLKDISIPVKCPSCSGALTAVGPTLVCKNSITCPDRVISQLIRIASPAGLDINGLGKVMSSRLVETGLVKEPGDIFRITYDQMIDAGFKPGESKRLMNSIEGLTVPLNKLIYSLCIPSVGASNAKILAKVYKTVDRLSIATIDHLTANTPLDPGEVQDVYDYFQSPNIYNEWPLVNVIPTDDTESVTSIKTWCITGSMEMSRNVIKTSLEEQGIKLTSSVTKSLDALFVGESPAEHKVLRAKALNIPIYPADQLSVQLKLLNLGEPQ